MSAIVAFIARPCDAGFARAAKPGRHGDRRPRRRTTAAAPAAARRPRSKQRTEAVTACRFAARTPSLFRPHKPIDQSVLTENRALVEDINRRNVLRGAVSLGALTMLTGCDVSENDSVQKALRAVSAWNDRVQAAIFRPDHLAPTFSAVAGRQAAALQRLLRYRGCQAGRRRDLETGIGRPDRRQAAMDRAADLPIAASRN